MGSAASAMENANTSAKDIPEELSDWGNFPVALFRDDASNDVSRDYRLWEFNIWQLDDEDLVRLTMNIANDFKFPELFGISTSVWCNFLWEIQRLMGTSVNPYHSYRHVVDVAQTCACIVREFSANVWLSDLSSFALYVAALVHDLEHPGTNNLYQVNACTPLAVRYNDISVLENHHCAKAFEVFMLPQCNITHTLNSDQKKYLRKTIIALVLSTDMTHHFNLRGELDGVITRNTQEAAPAKLNEQDTLVVLRSIIHTADISNPAKPWDICKKWSDLVLEEFLAQGDREKAENLPVSMNCDRDTTQQDELSMNFTDFIVAPFFFSMAKLLPKMLSVAKILESNRDRWNTMYTARIESTVTDETAKSEALAKWEGRRAGFTEKVADLEKAVHAIWVSQAIPPTEGAGETKLSDSSAAVADTNATTVSPRQAT